ncbi:phosphatidate cytidylyltransferase [Phaeovulum sp.]|uniref:phosphatidate cytidylyltransferase n=1 Tax=Phaeovulum sp. TaxID=2934796 RepID=UPI0027322007|nr:phosphatidate cytidylyltransferase [Phaeovulum sp.]MDP1670217.1 phosphatidate cytidylyltransferase [Phaeovulum sp.]MDZ4120287.1 phosphatidate cytidylyltransferase [Phaeovulum sp.]
MSAPGTWRDLPARFGSAVVMAVVGGAALGVGGVWFAALVVAVTAAMVWELARMSAPDRPQEALALATLAALVLAGVLARHSPFALALLLLPGLASLLRPRLHPLVAASYASALMLSGYAMVALREGAGLATILWLVAVVIASDLAGYFVGRSIGGPKFWPAISPKKTWSGTAAGWLGAAAVGAGFVLAGQGPWVLVAISPLVGFAGQLGDIMESWIKRRAGVKDSSALIPGHGGALDRFDALTGAVLAVLVLGLFGVMPGIGG